jgi:predicted 2-oxoglutarate/Fe(II)-dependent dioxygenase YbiX
MAGRGILLLCLPAGDSAARLAAVAAMLAQPQVFNNPSWATFLLCPDPAALAWGAQQGLPEQRVLVDEGLQVFAKLGVLDGQQAVQPTAFVLDMRLRVLAALPLAKEPQAAMQRLAAQLPALAHERSSAFEGMHPPVLVLPRVFSPKLCQALIQSYEQAGGQASGFMRDVDGQTVLVQDAAHKRRRDHMLTDPAMQQACMQAMRLRLLPELQKVFQFEATRMERHLVACYDASEQGYFRRHRDNTTRGTAHRRFAVSLFLNAPSEYEGGQLVFPEYGLQRFSASAGGAVVFSCAMLHEALPVTQGKRYMYLPFLFDETGAQIRERNQSAAVDPTAEDTEADHLHTPDSASSDSARL